MTAPTRKTAARVAIERPHAADHERSLASRMDKGIMPKGLPALLRWFSERWDEEVPTALHKSEVWHGRQEHETRRDPETGKSVTKQRWPGEQVGGSKLGSPAHSDPFRRYLENSDAECDLDGYFVRPMHAALSRLGRRWPLTARALFAVAQSGYDWRGVGVRGGWADEMFYRFLTDALEGLWTEYREQVVRLT